MSKIAFTPNASGTGTFTIASPNSNTNRTLTLPDADGALLNDASSLDASNLTGALPAIDGSALTNLPPAYTALSKAQTGYITLSGGLIIQWGKSGYLGTGGASSVTFATTFPNACSSVAMSPDSASTSNSFSWTSGAPSTSGVTFYSRGAVPASGIYYIAIGY